MSINKYKPHVWVLPEDDANRQLANGFSLHPELDLTALDIRPVAGGWLKATRAVVEQHAAELRKYQHRQLVLLIDLDQRGEARVEEVRDSFPPDLRDRVYLLGTRDQPETLKAAQGTSFEKIGEQLAEACARGEPGLWENEHLQHNAAELRRLMAAVKPTLFP